jgi:hypothetical protein
MGRSAKSLCCLCLIGNDGCDLLGTFSRRAPYINPEDAVKAYFNNLTPKAWALLVLPLIAIAYPVVSIVLPVVLRAVVPDVVRSVINLI